MRFSVIIPMYNVERYIGDCVKSVLKALPPESEVVIVDDKSTDSSIAIVEQIMSRDARVRLISASHEGAAAARNLGLAAASGEFFTFVDADDLVCENMFVDMLALMKSDVDLVICSQQKLALDGRVMNAIEKADTGIRRLETQKDAFFDCFYKNYGSAVWGRIYRRCRLFDDNGNQVVYFDTSLRILEDLCFVADYMSRMNGATIRTDEKLYMYRIKDYAKMPLELFEQQKRGYDHLYEVVSRIDIELADYVNITRTERMSRYIAKMSGSERRCEMGKDIRKLFGSYVNDVCKLNQVSLLKKIYYKALFYLPGLTGWIIKCGLYCTRKLGLTID